MFCVYKATFTQKRDNHTLRMISSVRVYGFPIDVKDRELHNIASRFDGCIRYALDYCNGGRVGLLEFASIDSAQHAAFTLHGHLFDPSHMQYLTVQFPNHYPTPDMMAIPMNMRERSLGEDWRQAIVPAHEKRKIIIKNLDLHTSEVILPIQFYLDEICMPVASAINGENRAFPRDIFN